MCEHLADFSDQLSSLKSDRWPISVMEIGSLISLYSASSSATKKKGFDTDPQKSWWKTRQNLKLTQNSKTSTRCRCNKTFFFVILHQNKLECLFPANYFHSTIFLSKALARQSGAPFLCLSFKEPAGDKHSSLFRDKEENIYCIDARREAMTR